MNILFLTSNEGFPLVWNEMNYTPRAVVGGFIFSIEKQSMLDELGVAYQIKPMNEIEFPEVIIEEEI